MTHRSSLVGRWGSRRQSADELGMQSFRFISALADTNPHLTTWHITGREASFETSAGLTPDSLSANFKQGRVKNDDGRIIEHLGYEISLENYQEHNAVLEIEGGGFNLVPGMHNQCMLSLKAPSADQTDSYESGTALRMLQCLISCWDPDWATWQTVPWIRLQKPVESRPIIGWFTYLKDVQVIEVPVGMVHPYGNGTIIHTAPRYENVTDEMIATLHHHLLATGELHNM